MSRRAHAEPDRVTRWGLRHRRGRSENGKLAFDDGLPLPRHSEPALPDRIVHPGQASIEPSAEPRFRIGWVGALTVDEIADPQAQLGLDRRVGHDLPFVGLGHAGAELLDPLQFSAAVVDLFGEPLHQIAQERAVLP